MYKIDRICVYLGAKCNLSCQYCMRNIDSSYSWDIEQVSDKFAAYLQGLDSNKVRAVVVTGGEPLLYMDSLKAVFKHVPKNIHKKIITNGTLIDADFVQYVNEYDIEVMLSHDGACTAMTRGIDVLSDHDLLQLIKAIKHLNISSTISNLNTDVEEVYDYISRKLDKDFYLHKNVIFANGSNEELLKDFDYTQYINSLGSLQLSNKLYIPDYYKYLYRAEQQNKRLNGVNFNLNGELINATTAEYLGDINEDNAVIEARMSAQYQLCNNSDCAIKNICNLPINRASEHLCSLQRQLKGGMNLNKSKKIKTVYLMLGSGCNFSCRHCVQEPMSAIESIAISDKCLNHLHGLTSDAANDKVRIHFWGGEPLLYFSTIKELVALFGDRFIYSIVSNGELLTESIVDFINSHHIRFTLSHDGPDTALVRGINILDNEAIKELFLKIDWRSLNMILTAHSQDIRACWQYFAETCPNTPSTLELLLHTWDYPSDLYAFDFARLEYELGEIAAKAVQDTWSGTYSQDVGLMEKYAYEIIRLMQLDSEQELQFKSFPTCAQIIHALNIDLDGNIYACHNSNDLIGSDGHDTYEELVSEYLAKHNHSFAANSECLSCAYLPICRGGCPIELRSDKRAVFCQVRKLFIEATIKYVVAFSTPAVQCIPTKFVD